MRTVFFFMLMLCSTAYGQQIILEQVSSDSVAKFEKKQKSKLDDQGNNTIMLSPQVYPMVSEKNLGQPYCYTREISDFRVPAISDYYFDKDGDSLWYSMVSWRATNGVSVFDWPARERQQINEISHKQEYVKFFKQLNVIITKAFGPPIKKTKELTYVGVNSVGEQVTWENSEVKIISEIQMPKGDEKNCLRVTMIIYWK